MKLIILIGIVAILSLGFTGGLMWVIFHFTAKFW